MNSQRLAKSWPKKGILAQAVDAKPSARFSRRRAPAACPGTGLGMLTLPLSDAVACPSRPHHATPSQQRATRPSCGAPCARCSSCEAHVQVQMVRTKAQVREKYAAALVATVRLFGGIDKGASTPTRIPTYSQASIDTRAAHEETNETEVEVRVPARARPRAA